MNSKQTEVVYKINEGQTVSHSGCPVLSIIVPVFQERDAIAETIDELMNVLGQINLPYELIVVDDGSTDGSHQQLQKLRSRYPCHLHVITHPYNKGNGAAVRTGIKAARGELIACMDADGQHDPNDLQRMLPYLKEYDLVIGARTKGYQGTWYRNLTNKLYNILASWLTKFRIEDLTSGYRVFRASVIQQYVHLFPARFSYPTTSTLAFIKGGHNVKFIPINARQRQGSTSKIKPMRDGWRFLTIIFKIIVIFEPLRVFLPTALILLLLAIASTAYSTWTLGRAYIPNSAVLLFTLSVLVVLLGLIAEQIAALHISYRDRD